MIPHRKVVILSYGNIYFRKKNNEHRDGDMPALFRWDGFVRFTKKDMTHRLGQPACFLPGNPHFPTYFEYGIEIIKGKK